MRLRNGPDTTLPTGSAVARARRAAPPAGSRPVARADFAGLIETESKRLGLDPALGRAVATAESNTDQRAVSGAGAIGVMQLMPDTAAELQVDPYDAADNIRGGLTYLKQLVDQFGDPKLALAAYNAGPGNVSKYGGVPPFAETQAYVGKVMGLAQRGGATASAAGGESVGQGAPVARVRTAAPAADFNPYLTEATRTLRAILASGPSGGSASDDDDTTAPAPTAGLDATQEALRALSDGTLTQERAQDLSRRILAEATYKAMGSLGGTDE
jgi:hypothetical protein